LFYGVLGAIVFRAIFVLAGAVLLLTFAWLVFVFGAFLLFTGVRMFRGGSGGGGTNPQNNRALRLFRRSVPTTEGYHGDHFS
jgi:predicted tellurium resistance membrane protein TerC